jgi:DNA-binding NarL/FixJ family response regulator
MNIVIIDQNKIFRESLKTVLDQIPDFKVILDMDNTGSLEDINNIEVHLILLDYSLGKGTCNEAIGKVNSLWPAAKCLLLTSYTEEYNFNEIHTAEIILKNATKKEFENRIRKQQSVS